MARLVPYTCPLAVMNLHDNRISLKRLEGFVPGAKLAASLKGAACIVALTIQLM